jgi:hypothetical protein
VTLLKTSLLPISLSVTEVDAETSTDLCNTVGIQTGYGLDGSVSIPDSVTFFFSPQRPNRHWSPSSLISNG